MQSHAGSSLHELLALPPTAAHALQLEGWLQPGVPQMPTPLGPQIPRVAAQHPAGLLEAAGLPVPALCLTSAHGLSASMPAAPPAAAIIPVRSASCHHLHWLAMSLCKMEECGGTTRPSCRQARHRDGWLRAGMLRLHQRLCIPAIHASFGNAQVTQRICTCS